MKYIKVYSGLVFTTILHSYCCIFPWFIGFWGSVTVLGQLLKFQPVFWLVQGCVLLFNLYNHYFRNRAPERKQPVRVFMLWGLLLYSVIIYIIPHTGWFKSEEEKIMIRQVSSVFKLKSSE